MVILSNRLKASLELSNRLKASLELSTLGYILPVNTELYASLSALGMIHLSALGIGFLVNWAYTHPSSPPFPLLLVNTGLGVTNCQHWAWSFPTNWAR